MRAVTGSHQPFPAGAQLPPQEVNSWGPTLRFWVPNPKTSDVKVLSTCLR
jgi:hypothetical protein